MTSEAEKGEKKMVKNTIETGEGEGAEWKEQRQMNSEREENCALLSHELHLVMVGGPTLPSDTEIRAAKLYVSQKMTHGRQLAAQEAEVIPQSLKTMTCCLSCLCSKFPFLCRTLLSLAQPIWLG